ncbi:caspase family protein [Bradyrhizobium sp. RT3b]|uniref:caspase family protein n=1 Tax=Bradyrhizobium sp. RT3b TaxID=3156334 RepID=UPI003395C858
MPRRRAAVVVGVNKTGGLPVLEGSVSGAESFGRWLTSEGFEVRLITDAAGPVTPNQIATAVEFFVKPGNVHQLVIYFSGHGYWKNDGELWLLSSAPMDANAAISWIETGEFAKDCGIPNVVLVSDACRSTPKSPQDLRVRGSIIFPNEGIQRERSKIDKFMAAAVGTAAFEARLNPNGRKVSVFTHCFLNAFSAPDAEMIKDHNEDGNELKVIPNRRLGKYLRREVAAILSSINVQLDQTPDAEVLSDEDAYIGRAPAAASIEAGGSPPFDLRNVGDIADGYSTRAPSAVEFAPNLREVADMAVARALDESPQGPSDNVRSLERLAESSGFNAALDQASVLADVAAFEMQSGFAVLGARISDAMTANGEPLQILAPGDDENPGVVRIGEHLNPACTVVIRFTSGRSVALAALHGFLGHVLVDGTQVINISYVPSDKSPRWREYSGNRKRVERLRAAVAAAVRLGSFRLADDRRATLFANNIRLLKGLDPSLGVYAAYAYSQADRRADIGSILSTMKEDLSVDLFDVAMLSRQRAFDARVVPFCPMLTQGWNLLRARGIKLPQVLDEAQDELEQGLWTTFNPRRSQLIIGAIRRGEFR